MGFYRKQQVPPGVYSERGGPIARLNSYRSGRSTVGTPSIGTGMPA